MRISRIRQIPSAPLVNRFSITSIDADVGQFEDGVSGEEIGGVVPHLSVGVVAVRVLQIDNLVLVVRRLDASVECGESV